jgi:WD40 repeat protein
MIRRYASVLVALLCCAGCAPLRPAYELGDGRRHGLAAAFAPDGRVVAAADSAGLGRVWDTQTGRELARCDGFAASREVSCRRRLTFAPGGDVIAFAAGDGSVRVWNWHDGGVMRDLRGLPQLAVHVIVTPESRVVAIAGGHTYVPATTRTSSRASSPSGPSVEPLTVVTWDVASGRTILARADKASGALFAALSADGQRVAAVGMPRKVTVWDVESGREIARVDTLGSFMSTHIAFSPDGRFVFTSGLGGYRSAPGVLLDSATGDVHHRDQRSDLRGGPSTARRGNRRDEADRHEPVLSHRPADPPAA